MCACNESGNFRKFDQSARLCANTPQRRLYMNYTQNLRLPQFDGGDRIHHDDFNEAFGKIDAAVSGKCSMLFGTYHGDGNARKTISLSVTPKVIIIWLSGHGQFTSSIMGGVAFDGTPSDGITVIDNGFTVENNGSIDTNDRYGTYYYIALY